VIAAGSVLDVALSMAIGAVLIVYRRQFAERAVSWFGHAPWEDRLNRILVVIVGLSLSGRGALSLGALVRGLPVVRFW
jgi:hypothetical protein